MSGPRAHRRGDPPRHGGARAPLVQRLGGGGALWVVLLAGAAGNVLAALGHEAAHVAVGASTATFGALGPPGPVVQWVLAALVVVACWALALAPPP